MSTGAPTSRKTHVTRIFGTNKKKEILSDIWADVERIDSSTSRDKVDGVRQKLIRKFKWRDDPADTDQYLDPDVEDTIDPSLLKRKTVLLKVCNPDEKDLSDPDVWIPIRVIKRIRSKRNSLKNDAKQLQYENLINSDIQQSRVVEQRRFVHYDTNIDDKVQKAIDDDPTLKAYVIKGSEYQKLDGSAEASEFADEDNTDTKDKDQYVEHEVATKLLHRGNKVYYGNNEPADSGRNAGRQHRVTKMRNQYLIDASDPAKLEEVGENDFNPPYRLDPFQNIINVNWGGGAVEYQDKNYSDFTNSDIPKTKKLTISIWFRVPQESLDTCKARWKAWFDAGQRHVDRVPMHGTVPVMTLGGPRKSKYYTVTPEDSGPGFNEIVHRGDTVESTTFVPDPQRGVRHYDAPVDIDPSFIGVDCTGEYPMLALNLILQDNNDCTHVKDKTFSYSGGDLNVQFAGNRITCPAGTPEYLFGNSDHYWDWTNTQTYIDATDGVDALNLRPQTFRFTARSRTGDNTGLDMFDGENTADFKGLKIIGDHWHHLLLSIDLTNEISTVGTSGDTIVGENICGASTGSSQRPPPPDLLTEGKRTKSACQMSLAFDDKNYKASEVSAYWPATYGDKNALITTNAFAITNATSYNINDQFWNAYGTFITLIVTGLSEMPFYKLTPKDFDMNNVAIPASKIYKDSILRVEIGAVQIFTDTFIDTSDEDVRRAFITKKGKPASMGAAAKLIDKQPEFKVNNVSAFKKATNQGTSEKKPVVDGLFSKDIKRYSPSPNLYDDQGKP